MTIDSKKNAIKYAKQQTWFQMPKARARADR